MLRERAVDDAERVKRGETARDSIVGSVLEGRELGPSRGMVGNTQRLKGKRVREAWPAESEGDREGKREEMKGPRGATKRMIWLAMQWVRILRASLHPI